MDQVVEQIKEIAMKYQVDKLVLFGSRARGDHTPVSDYDIAIFQKSLSPLDQACLSEEVDEIQTLKKIDIVFVRENTADELAERIRREGVIIYG
ncbi:MAG: nucleotidyltransferase domain-containing protein [Peptococcaceae bacterium]|nr:nucleotidyltransferase domain-containing protein [Peptococcaceae bacterium]